MPITAIPVGVVIKNVTPAEKRALDELIGKERDNISLKSAILVGIPSIIAGSAVLAYVFKEEAKEWYEEKKGQIKEAIVDAILWPLL